MAIDWESMDGYTPDMTAEQKLELLDKQEAKPVETPPTEVKPEVVETKPMKTAEKTISKAAYDKLASELSSVKKQLRSRMTESEQLEEQRKEQDESMRLELETLRKERALSDYKAKLIGLGYGENDASEFSSALYDKDMDNVFALMAKQNQIFEKSLNAKFLKNTPVPPAGDALSEEQKQKQEDLKFRKYFGL